MNKYMRNPVLRPVSLDDYIEAKVSGDRGGGEREKKKASKKFIPKEEWSSSPEWYFIWSSNVELHIYK